MPTQRDLADLVRGSRFAKIKEEQTKLVLFDIDGVISVGGLVTKSVHAAITAELGPVITLEAFEARVNSGTTLRTRLGNLWAEINMPEEERTAFTERIIALGMKNFKEELKKSPIKLLPGVTDLLAELDRTLDLYIGIVTNNITEAMEIKMRSVGLFGLFLTYDFITTGDEGGSKAELVKVAIAKAEKSLGVKRTEKNTFFIGDQASDITAGREAGISAIGVCTGRSSIEELEKAGARLVVPDLSNTRYIMDTIHCIRRIKNAKLGPKASVIL